MSSFESEEVIHREWSEDWEKDMPVTLLKHKADSFWCPAYSIHCQTGDHHITAIEKAQSILSKRGLYIEEAGAVTIGPSGMYYNVVPLH